MRSSNIPSTAATYNSDSTEEELDNGIKEIIERLVQIEFERNEQLVGSLAERK